MTRFYERCLLAASLLGGACLLFALALPMFQGKIFVQADLQHYHYPLRQFYSNCLKSGDSFSWLPSLHCGYYVHGEGQVGMYHPFHLLLYRFLPLDVAFNIELLANYPFIFLGMFLFLRRWRLPSYACAFGAFVYAFSAFNLSHFFHINAIAVIAHLPWLLWSIDMCFRSRTNRRKLRALVYVAILTGSQLLLGFPQAVYFSVLSEVLYVFLLVAGRISCSWKPAKDVLCAATLTLAGKLLGCGLAAVQILPTLAFLDETLRADTTAAFRSFYSLHPLNLVQFVGPDLLANGISFSLDDPHNPHESALYCGALAVPVLLWFLWPRLGGRDSARSRSVRAWRILGFWSVGLMLLALALSLGRYAGIYDVISSLPLLNAFRCPCRHVVLVHFAAAVVFAVCLADLGNETERRFRHGFPVGVAIVVAWITYAVIAHFAGPTTPGTAVGLSANLGQGKQLLIAPALVTAAAILVLTAASGRRPALLFLICFAVVDQAVYGLRFVYREPAIASASFLEGIALPPIRPGERYCARGNNLGVLLGMRNAGGYTGPGLKRYLSYDYRHRTPLRLAGVGAVATRQSSPKPGVPVKWRRVPDPMPKVRLVSRFEVSDNPARDTERFNIRATAVVLEDVGVVESHGGGEARLLCEAPGRMSIRVDTPMRQILVISESFSTGWRAKSSGKPCPLFRVYGDFMGCVVETGVSEIELVFDPVSLRVGRYVSLAAAFFLATLWLLSVGAARRFAGHNP